MLAWLETWRLISMIELESSSVAAATVETLALASDAAAATFSAWSSESLDERPSDWAVPSSVFADSTRPTRIVSISWSKPRAMRATSAARCSRAACSLAASACSTALRRMFSAKTATARAMLPTSSLRSAKGIATEVSPLASWFIVPVMERIGAPMELDSQKKNPIDAAMVTAALSTTTRKVVSRALVCSAPTSPVFASSRAIALVAASSSLWVMASPAPVTSMARDSLTVSGWRMSASWRAAGPLRQASITAPISLMSAISASLPAASSSAVLIAASI